MIMDHYNYAIDRHNTAPAKLLINEGADVNGVCCHNSPSNFFFCQERIGLAKYLINKGIAVNILYDDYWPLFKVIQCHANQWANLKNNGAYMNGICYNESLINFAVVQKQIDIVRYLIEKGTAVNGVYEDNPPLYFAIGVNHIEIAKYLIDSGANVNGVTDDSSP